jgi:hypothetical protein
MGYRVAGKSLIAFGAAILVSTVIVAVLLESLTIDLLAVAVVALGVAVRDGSARAARWSIAVMVIYLLLAVVFVVVGNVRPDLIKIGGRMIRPEEMPWALLSCVVVGIWSAINIALLRRALQSAGETA